MITLAWLLIMSSAFAAHSPNTTCAERLHPREIDSAKAFADLVDWIHDEVIVARGAPGLVVGISGTDSILAFMAVARAFERAGQPHKAVGLHFGSHADADEWFQRDVIPWLRRQAPGARVLIDASIDHHQDGLRWGALLDWSTRGERHWVVGTRNASETLLGTYSNLSRAVSVQPLTHLWKSEVLRVCRHLGAPGIAIDRSAQADCACGRENLPALHIPEVDALLMARVGQVPRAFVRRMMSEELYQALDAYVETQFAETEFKSKPPLEFAGAVPEAQSRLTGEELGHLKLTMAADRFSGRALTSHVPALIAEERALVAADLVTTPAADRAAWLPEALTLFNVPGLRTAQRARMIESVFGTAIESTPTITRLARLSGRLGYLGFGFARWRYLFKSYHELPSLAVRWGFRALARATDRDLGLGFKLERGESSVEFRQAYLLASVASAEGPVTLVLRNNSHVFGRDLLGAAGYVAWRMFDASTLEDLSAERLERDSRFIPLDQIFTAELDVPLLVKIRRLEHAVAHVDEIEKQFNDWARQTAGGFQFLIDVLRRAARDGNVYLAETRPGEPAWQPAHATKVDESLLRKFERRGRVDLPTHASDQTTRLTIMSGPRGDFP